MIPMTARFARCAKSLYVKNWEVPCECPYGPRRRRAKCPASASSDVPPFAGSGSSDAVVAPRPPARMPPALEDLEERVHRLEIRVQDLEAQTVRSQSFETGLAGLENTIIRWGTLQDLLNGLTGLCATFAANFTNWHAGMQQVLPG